MTSPTLTSDLATTNDGPAWAALLASAIGTATFGLLTVTSEASAPIANLLKWYPPAGALSGVAILSVTIWLAAWYALHAKWKRRSLSHPWAVMAASVLLVLAAFIATFPPFYELFVKGK